MEFNYKFENWEYKMLENFYNLPATHFDNLIKSIIKQNKDICVDKYIDYCKENDLPISYNSEEELIDKMYGLGLLKNLNELNKNFLENH